MLFDVNFSNDRVSSITATLGGDSTETTGLCLLDCVDESLPDSSARSLVGDSSCFAFLTGSGKVNAVDLIKS